MTQPNPPYSSAAHQKAVPALARTDVHAPEHEVTDPGRLRIGRAISIGVAVLAAVALLVFGLLFALRQELVDSALLNADFLDAWR